MSTETLPDGTEVVRVDRPDFQLDEPQVYHHSFRNEDRVVRFTGTCVTCATRCYSHDDGDDDPRGILGEHADHTFTARDYEMVGPDVPSCSRCYNDYDLHQAALVIAKKRWREPPETIDLTWLREHQAEPEAFWEPARLGDGYDRMEAASHHGWLALSAWGRDGWDFLEWPYYVGYVRNVATDDGERFELATNCEGDVDVWRFDTIEKRQEAIDDLAFWHWQSKSRSWVEGVFPDERPDHLRGPYRTS